MQGDSTPAYSAMIDSFTSLGKFMCEAAQEIDDAFERALKAHDEVGAVDAVAPLRPAAWAGLLVILVRSTRVKPL